MDTLHRMLNILKIGIFLLLLVGCAHQETQTIEFTLNPNMMTAEQYEAALCGFADAITSVITIMQHNGADRYIIEPIISGAISIQYFNFTLDEMVEAENYLKSIQHDNL